MQQESTSAFSFMRTLIVLGMPANKDTCVSFVSQGPTELTKPTSGDLVVLVILHLISTVWKSSPKLPVVCTPTTQSHRQSLAKGRRSRQTMLMMNCSDRSS